MATGYIFDFDGVLVYTMAAHFQCYKQALAEANVPIDKDQFYRQAGMAGVEQIKYFADKAGAAVDPQQVYQRKRQLWAEADFDIQAIPCNVDWFMALRREGRPVAIATGSTRPSVVPIIEKVGLDVDVLVTAEDVPRGKPHPDLFLCAAERLGMRPEDCLVIEDSEAGLQAAQAAGMKVLMFIDNQQQ